VGHDECLLVKGAPVVAGVAEDAGAVEDGGQREQQQGGEAEAPDRAPPTQPRMNGVEAVSA
jgi:hypothetical protein